MKASRLARLRQAFTLIELLVAPYVGKVDAIRICRADPNAQARLTNFATS